MLKGVDSRSLICQKLVSILFSKFTFLSKHTYVREELKSWLTLIKKASSLEKHMKKHHMQISTVMTCITPTRIHSIPYHQASSNAGATAGIGCGPAATHAGHGFSNTIMPNLRAHNHARFLTRTHKSARVLRTVYRSWWPWTACFLFLNGLISGLQYMRLMRIEPFTYYYRIIRSISQYHSWYNLCNCQHVTKTR